MDMRVLDRHVALLVGAICLVGCDSGGLRLEPPQIQAADWSTAELRLSGLSPALYLDMDDDRLSAASDLRVVAEGAPLEVSRIDEHGVWVRPVSPLPLGQYEVTLSARGRVWRAAPMLTVVERLSPDSGADVGVDGEIDAAVDAMEDGGAVTLPGWTRVRRLVIDNTSGPEALSDFTILVSLSPDRIDYDAMSSDGADLRFTNDDGSTFLSYEIDRWDVGGRSAVWLRVPRIEAEASTEIRMYYGNPGAAPGESPEATWSAAHRGVWHMNEDLRDSTSAGNHGSDLNTIGVAALIGDGRWLNADTGHISVGSAESIDNIFEGGGTISALFRADGWGESRFGRIVDKSSSRRGDEGWALQLYQGGRGTDTLRMERGFRDAGSIAWVPPSGIVMLDTWHHVAVTYDDRTESPIRVYVDGIQVLSAPSGAAPSDAAQSDAANDLYIGNRAGSDDRTFDGILDEVRLEKGMRSSAWIAAQHRSINDAMISYLPEERR